MRRYLRAALGPDSDGTRDDELERWLSTNCLTLEELDREKVAQIARRLILKLDGSPLAATTAARYRTNTRACIRAAVEVGAIPADPWPPRSRSRSQRKVMRAKRSVDVKALARRPKLSKVVENPALRRIVETKLAEFWSPEQIAGWLRVEYPDDVSMWVSHEAIYLALYAKQLTASPKQCLRTRRPLRRRRHRRKNLGQGRIRNPTMISERPAHVEDRIDFGHWEGDLIIGNRSTALATLVERVSRYTILVPLPGARTMDALNLAVTAALRKVPDAMKRSLAWDQGKEIHGHEQLAESAGVVVYVCNPHSPWQRGSNENTNGLLRQWLPRSTDFYLLDR